MNRDCCLGENLQVLACTMKTAAQITDEGLSSWSSNISLKRDMDWYSVSSSSVDDLIKINSPADICAGH